MRLLPRSRTAAGLLAGTLLLTACGSDEPAGTTTAPLDASPVADDDSPADDAGPSDDRDASAGPRGTVAVDRTESHPNGTEITVRSVTIEDTAVLFDIAAFNGGPDPVRLVSQGTTISLVDGQDTRYSFQAPDDNPELEIAAVSELEGRIAFAGRVPEGVESLSLRFNYTIGPLGPPQARTTPTPTIIFDALPVPSS